MAQTSELTDRLASALYLNHQTHHRGQATTLLAQLGVDFGVTDLIAFYRRAAAGGGG